MDFSWLGREWEDECEIKKKFNFFDNNPQNGQLSYRELQSAMYGIGYNHSDEEIRKMPHILINHVLRACTNQDNALLNDFKTT